MLSPQVKQTPKKNMRKLVVFNQLSLDGYFTDKYGDMTWAKENSDAEFDEFTTENARGGGTLLFGRVTYDLMASFWPTPQASKILPLVAERMNNLPKAVFSRTMKEASWKNTKVIKGDIAAQIRKMKKESGEGMAIFGSGNIISQLAKTGLIDEYQIVLNPIALGAGRTMFEGIKERLHLKLTKSRVFKNGKVFLCYEPA
jgi:dihydrofolate reductase